MISLASSSVSIRIDPRHGGEVLDLIDVRTGRQLLGRPPFASDEPVSGELDETTWTRCYRGGWQLLVPNAGNACVVDGIAHGFHGRASTDPWEVTELALDGACLSWEGHGIRVQRRFTLADDRVAVGSTITADQTVSLVWVEHVGLGIEMLDPAIEIALAGGQAYEVDERTGPTEAPADAPRWPQVRLLDGTLERGDRAEVRSPRSRMMIVANVPEGHLTVHNHDRRQGLELSWDTKWLPHLWMWHEVRSSGGPWRELAETLIVEPASVPHTLGLEMARDRGQAHRLEAGETRSAELVLRPLVDAP
ncbi:MAG TPA: hypothetical protein VG371_15870 [Solirubrobacteraceae bacterium]|jgi:hypothetical protein|nr:hypothetical protein [Solirubrobacteraceae bacterium]